MKAVVVKRWGGSDAFEEVDNYPIPEIPDGSVLVRIRAAGFNPVDYKIREGRFGGQPPQQGLVLGGDFAGVIVKVGNNCKRGFKEGDQVYGLAIGGGVSNGTYSQYLSINEGLLGKTPRNVPVEESAGMVITGLTAIECHSRAHLQSHHSVLVTGASGGVGSTLIQLIKNSNVKNLFVTAGTQKSIDYLHNHFGIPTENIINYQGLSVQQLGEKIIAANNGKGIDVCFDLYGGDMKLLAFEVLGMDGHLITIVEEPDPNFKTPLYPAIDPRKNLFAVNGTFHMIFVGAKALGSQEYWHRTGSELDQLTSLLEGKNISPSPITLIGELSLDTVRQAHERLEAHHNTGKLVMTVQ